MVGHLKLDWFTSLGGRARNEDCASFLSVVPDIGSQVVRLLHGKNEVEPVPLDKEPSGSLPAGFASIALADGMGGHAGGFEAALAAVRAFQFELARQIASPVASKSAGPEDQMGRAISRAYEFADGAVKAQAPVDAGATLVSAVVLKNTLWTANLGDSRAMVIGPGGGKVFVTKDHTFVRMLIDSGALTEEEARDHPRRNMVTRALGKGKHSPPDITKFEGCLWNAVLLFSDGAIPGIDDALAGGGMVAARARDICTAAGKLGSDDNATCAILARS